MSRKAICLDIPGRLPLLYLVVHARARSTSLRNAAAMRGHIKPVMAPFSCAITRLVVISPVIPARPLPRPRRSGSPYPPRSRAFASAGTFLSRDSRLEYDNLSNTDSSCFSSLSFFLSPFYLLSSEKFDFVRSRVSCRTRDLEDLYEMSDDESYVSFLSRYCMRKRQQGSLTDRLNPARRVVNFRST